MAYIQILQCSVFQLLSKNCAVAVAIFSICLFTLLRSHSHLVTDEILHYEYPSSVSSFMNKSQIRLRPDLQNLNPVQP